MKSFVRKAKLFTATLFVVFTAGSGLFGAIAIIPSAKVEARVDCGGDPSYHIDASGNCVQGTPGGVTTTATGWDAVTDVNERAILWTELAAVSHCVAPSYVGNDLVTSGKWLTDGNNSSVAVGSHVDSTDGRYTCDNEKGWFTHLLAAAGYPSGQYSVLYDQVKNKSNDPLPNSFDIQKLASLLKAKLFPNGMPSSIPDYVKYDILMAAFTNNNGGDGCQAKDLTTATPDVKSQYTTPAPVDIWIVDPTTGQAAQRTYGFKNAENTVTVGWNVNTSNGGRDSYQCKTLASMLGDARYANDLASKISQGIIDGSSVVNVDGQTGAEDADTGCDLNGDPFTWFVCPVIDSLEGMIQKVDNFITESLTFNTDDFFNKNVGYKTAWNSFRVLATGILVIAGLVMVASQALGLEILDAYTIKKVLPRLLIAVIGMSLSWPLMHYVIDFFNILGTDVRNLIYSPFSNLTGNIGAGAAGVLAGGGVIGLFVLGPAGILSFLATAALAVLVGFVIIMVRYLALIVMIILAPVAIAAYILPNTQKIWNLWKDNFLGLLLVFPIISAFIAVGKVFSAVSLSDTGSHAFGSGTIMQIVGLVAYFLPYFLLPIAFRLATGAIGAIAGFVNDRHRGAFDGLKNFRGNKVKSNVQAIKENRRYNPNAKGVRGRFNRGLNSALSSASSPGDSAKIYGGQLLRAGGFNTSLGSGVMNQVERQKFEHSQKASEVMASTFNDRGLRAIMGMKDTSAGAIRARGQELLKSTDVQERNAGEQLLSNAAFLSSELYKNPEMGRANLQAAAGMALSAHGFADTNDIAQLGNSLGGTRDGFAQMVVGQSAANSLKAGRADFKHGYGMRPNGAGGWEGLGTTIRSDIGSNRGDVVMTGADGKPVMGDDGKPVMVPNLTSIKDTAAGKRALATQVDRIKGMGVGEWTQGKTQQMDALSDGIEEIMHAEVGDHEYVDAAGNKQKYTVTDIDKDRILEGFAAAMGPHGYASADHANRMQAIADRAGKGDVLKAKVEAQRRGGHVDETHTPGSPAAHE